MNDGEEDDDQDPISSSLPMQPEKLFFNPTEFGKACKIVTRYSVTSVVQKIEAMPEEAKWFKTHPQFRHIFHMPKERNHMSQGLWMLLLYTAKTGKESECWFVVNGVPIRYSLREHALLCGLDCHEYPRKYKDLGCWSFVERQFGRKKAITVKDVEERLEAMETSEDKKKMAVLFFLSKVVKAGTKANGNIESFLLRVVNDLRLCKKFPWGDTRMIIASRRYSV
ncbi:uncharacterized protein At3g43530-like [Eutrema salsugineum]|uniref:uncharacterized protein At3g43530-like n=1 Tax=Eutrema salsugineum TaxID=72664 RepID=UPI000CECF1E5|nr:uncharacterized protein At3g43530-like [Eutrema salsugineum]